MAVKLIIVAVLLTTSGALAQTDPTVKDVISNLPTELQGQVNETVVADVKNKSMEVFKEKCVKNGGAEAFINAQNASETFPNCVKESLGLGDMRVLMDKIEVAKKNGSVDEVFKTYCARKGAAQECFRDMTEAVKPCFTSEEQNNLETVYNVTEQLVEFICYKDGDRIALFIAEHGPECFQEKHDEILMCANTTLGVDLQLNANNMSAVSLPDVAFGEKECGKIADLQKCFVGALEKCQAPTSANIVESLFRFALKATPCKNLTEPNSASGLAVTSAAIVFAVIATLF